jgi:Tol biopolymer transport system component
MVRTPLIVLALVAALVAGCGSGAAFSPDLAFVSTRDGDYAIYGMAADGSHQRRLTKEKGDPATPRGLLFQVEPAWSPDASKIAFASSRDGRSHIYVMAADGSGTTRLTSGKHDDGSPTWSPDGKWIAFSRDGTLCIVGSNGGTPRRVMKDPGEVTEPAWSPDGKWIAYVVREPGFTAHEVWRVRPNGTDRQQVTRLDADSRGPAWSPDSRRIAFSSDKLLKIAVIYTITIGRKAAHVLTGGATTGAYEPAWSPDGKTIAFWSDGSIYTIALGGKPEPITSDQNNSSPAWRPVQPAGG